MLIAVPVFRLSCKVGVDKGRAWSVVDELLLWALARKPRTIAELSKEAGLKRQLVVASIARLMRFRLIELSVAETGALFRASPYGAEVVASGQSLPFFPKREPKRVSFVIERVSGSFFPSGQVRLVPDEARARASDTDVRLVVVEGGGPSLSHEANFARLSKIAARGVEEQLGMIDGRTASLRPEFMLIRVVDGVPRNIPESASDTLRRTIEEAAAAAAGTTQIPVSYQGLGAQAEVEPAPVAHASAFNPEKDLVIGGSAQLELFKTVLANACRRVIVHSTFLDHRRFRALADDFRDACRKGVAFDLLWGAETRDTEEDSRNGAEAVEIARIIRDDPDLARRVRIHMRTTGSHAKLILADRDDGGWTAAIGSCNWLSTPFRAVEMTAVLSEPALVADVVAAVQRMVGRRGLSDDIANEMAIVARDLKNMPRVDGPANVSLLPGDGHEALMRVASGAAAKRMIVGSHRLGSTARPGVVMQGETAAGRASAAVALLYTMPSGPLKNRHARKLAEEAAGNGVKLLRVDPPLHGKFLVWDDDDLAVTSLNWASASQDPDFPQSDLGVHISSPGIATHVIRKLSDIYPALSKILEDHLAPPD